MERSLHEKEKEHLRAIRISSFSSTPHLENFDLLTLEAKFQDLMFSIQQPQRFGASRNPLADFGLVMFERLET